MHPWHDIYVDDHIIGAVFPAIIEVPMGSKNKYELDKESGLLRLDRVLYSAVYYPANYGFIPRTYCDDGDPLDALVLGQESVHPLTVVEGRYDFASAWALTRGNFWRLVGLWLVVAIPMIVVALVVAYAVLFRPLLSTGVIPAIDAPQWQLTQAVAVML